MQLTNTTQFPALAFQATGQHCQPYHVVVMRATFDIKPDGALAVSVEQEPIVLTDEYFGEINRSSVRQESDLVPFKPQCDVIVNATAYAPGGRPSTGFIVGVRVNKPPDERGEPGLVVLDKNLVVTGPRCWEKGLLGGWKLRPPTMPITSLPLRYEYAFGGECRIEMDDSAAERVGRKFLLGPEQRASHPDGAAKAPLAHAVYDDNPLGMGFAEEWYLKAKRMKIFPAPQIDSPENPVSVLGNAYAPQGFGIITKAWKQRLELAGTYGDAWRENRWPHLPEDFDMEFWNGAHPDMRIPFPEGGEKITLTNLTPGGKLTISLPDHEPVVHVRREDGTIMSGPLKIDTLIIEPDSMKISLVSRVMFAVYREIAPVEASLSI
jgi:hypothetical protein